MNSEQLHTCEVEFTKYVREVTFLLSNKLSTKADIPADWSFDEKTEEIQTMKIDINDGCFSNFENFSVRFKEVSRRNNRYTNISDFSYQLRNEYDNSDFIRFDFDRKEIIKGYPPLHANADEKTWGKAHLIYPKDINLNLGNLNCIKAYYIFFHYLHHPSEHPYDMKNNTWYANQLKGK